MWRVVWVLTGKHEQCPLRQGFYVKGPPQVEEHGSRLTLPLTQPKTRHSKWNNTHWDTLHWAERRRDPWSVGDKPHGGSSILPAEFPGCVQEGKPGRVWQALWVEEWSWASGNPRQLEFTGLRTREQEYRESAEGSPESSAGDRSFTWANNPGRRRRRGPHPVGLVSSARQPETENSWGNSSGKLPSTVGLWRSPVPDLLN